MTLSQRLVKAGISLPEVSGPFGAYVPAKAVGGLLFLAGQLPMRDGKLIATGLVPSACSIDQARLGARQCVIQALAAARTAVADLEQIAGVVRVAVFVASESDFTDQPKIANAASELLLELFGDAGKHARTSLGVASLPLGAAVEVEVTFQLAK